MGVFQATQKPPGCGHGHKMQQKKKKKRAKKGRGLGKRCSYASKYNKQGGNDVRKTRADMKEGANMVCKTVLETLLKKNNPTTLSKLKYCDLNINFGAVYTSYKS